MKQNDQLKQVELFAQESNSKTNQGILTPNTSEKSIFHNDALVCFCFEYTRNDIKQDYLQNGQSLIMAKILAEKKASGCDCAKNHPKGR
jgi:hypothetical protein